MNIQHATTFRNGALVAALALASSAAFAAEPYQIDPNHTQVEYTYSHFGFSHITGHFSNVEGDFLFDAKDPTKSSIQVHVPINTISVGMPDLDKELVGPTFFDADKFPLATFQSTAVTSPGPGKLAVAGDLTIHGVTKPVTLDVTVNKIGTHPMRNVAAAGFDATATIKRSDFGVALYVPNVSDEVTLHITMEAFAPKQQAPKAK
jgi:polyisoprenoid-binding protein YceI